MLSNDSSFQESVSANVEFLFQAHSNTQRAIQFFDTKAGAYVAANGVLASLLVSSIVHAMSELSRKSSVVPRCILLVLLSGIALVFLYQVAQVFYQAFLVLFPRYGLDLVEKGDAVGLFWAGNIVEYLQNHSLEQYADAVCKMSQRDLVVELSYEVAKLSQITSIKLEQLKKATQHCKWAILSWGVLLVVIGFIEVLLPHLL